MLRVLRHFHQLSLCTRNVNSLNNSVGKSLSKDTKNSIPVSPKKPLTVFLRFVKDRIHQTLKENPGFTIPQTTALLGKKWRESSPEFKRIYEDAYLKDVSEHKNREEAWLNSLTEEQKATLRDAKAVKKLLEQRKQRKKECLEFGKPKRPLNSMTAFLQEKLRSGSVSKTDGYFTNNRGQLFKEFVNKWRTMSKEEKEPFEVIAAKDKERYTNEIQFWRLKMMKEGHSKHLEEYRKIKHSNRPYFRKK